MSDRIYKDARVFATLTIPRTLSTGSKSGFDFRNFFLQIKINDILESSGEIHRAAIKRGLDAARWHDWVPRKSLPRRDRALSNGRLEKRGLARGKLQKKAPMALN